jgi:hypothetical protein
VSVRKLSEAKNSGPDLKPIVNTKKPKKTVFNKGGITTVPNWPRIIDTIRVQAVIPIANPWIRSLPSATPPAIARNKKISGALIAMCCTHAMSV